MRRSPWLMLWGVWFAVGCGVGLRSWLATDLSLDPKPVPVECSPVLSGDGKRLAFERVRQDGSGITDIVVYDVDARTYTVCDRAQGGKPDDSSFTPSLDYSGQVLAFASRASNWVAGDYNSLSDVFWVDLKTEAVTRLVAPNPRPGTSSSFRPTVSRDGLTIGYTSYGVPEGDVVRGRNLCLYHRDTGETSVFPGWRGGRGPLLGSVRFDSSGQKFVFSAFCADLAPEVPQLCYSIFLGDQAGNVRLLTGGRPDANSYEPVLSERDCVFSSLASNLVEGDTNLCHDIFAVGVESGSKIERLVGGNDSSLEPTVSEDGRWVAFTTWATNLVPGDSNACSDVMLLDRSNGKLECLTLEGNGHSFRPTMSADGSTIAFVSRADNLAQHWSRLGVYVWRRGHGLEAVEL